jgi:plasmid maintenance system antidote protein VapI
MAETTRQFDNRLASADRTSSANGLKHTRDSRLVKAQIIAAGVKFRALAAEAGIAPSTLSEYISGRYREPERQIAIVQAFNRLAGTSMTAAEFWLGLTHEILAA